MNTSALINVLAVKILAADSHDKDFINQYTFGLDPYIASLSNFAVEKIAKQNSLPVDIFNQALELIKDRKVSFVIGADTLNLPDGKQLIDAMINFAFLTGSIGVKGSGIYVLAAENNLVGAMDMGAVPNLLPGRVKIPLEKDQGLDLGTFIASAESGKIKAVFIMGENLLRMLPQQDRVKACLLYTSPSPRDRS